MSLIIVLLLGLLARAQDAATAPRQALLAATQQWLTEPRAPKPALSERGVAITFDRERKVDLAQMTGRLGGARLLACGLYDGPPATLASDVSQQLQAIEDLPQEALAPLIIDRTKAAHADAVAGEWARDLLEAGQKDTVVALVFWFADESQHSLLDGAIPEPRLVLVLARAHLDAAGELAIQRIAWGAVTP